MKYTNTMTYYFTNVRGRLEGISIPNDHLFEKAKEAILAKLDSQLAKEVILTEDDKRRGEYDVPVIKTVMAMYTAISGGDYPYKNKIFDPAELSKIAELRAHLGILINIYNSETQIEVPQEEKKYIRIENPHIVTKNGVLEQYDIKPQSNTNRIPNEY